MTEFYYLYLIVMMTGLLGNLSKFYLFVWKGYEIAISITFDSNNIFRSNPKTG